MKRRATTGDKQGWAIELQRHLLSLRRTEGIPYWEGGKLYLLSCPADLPPDPAALAVALLERDLPARGELARLVGAAECLLVEPEKVGKWTYDLDLLARSDLDRLVAEGVRPLRGLRGKDPDDRLAEMRSRVDRLRRLVAAGRTYTGDPDKDTAHWVELLPLCLDVLGEPPVELSTLRVPGYESSLLELARDPVPERNMLAGILLGLRARRSLPGEQIRLETALPARAQAAFRHGRSGISFYPVLEARFLAAGLHVPDLTTLPVPERERFLRVAERISHLYGPVHARTQLLNLIRPWLDAARPGLPLRERLDRLRHLVQWACTGRVPADLPVEELPVVQALQALHQGLGGPRDVVDLFLDWVSHLGERLRGIRPLVRLATRAWPRGLRATMEELARTWEELLRGSHLEQHQTTNELSLSRLTLGLTTLKADLEIPARFGADRLNRLREWLTPLSIQRVREIWPIVCGFDTGQLGQTWDKLLASALPTATLERIGRLDVVCQANAFLTKPARLTAYLDCLEELLRRKLPGLDPREEWLADFFQRGPDFIPAVVLTILQRADPANPVQLHDLCRDLFAEGSLADHARALREAIADWNTAHLIAEHPDLHSQASTLGLSPAQLVEYLHHRRLAGHGEKLAQALLEPLELHDRETNEAEFLDRKLAQIPVDAPARAALMIRLERLRDPVQRAGRQEQAADRARHRLARSLELLRRESLECVLDGVYRLYLTRFLGHPIEGVLPPGLREALPLLSRWNLDLDLCRGFLEDVLARRSLHEREPNRAWLDRAASAGVNTQRWLAGFDATLTVAGERIHFATERDPLHVLRMGSYFNTCLSLEDGCNAASTLVNALDVNKQVLYGRRADGKVVARKLIGASARGECFGYRTYATEQSDEVRLVLNRALAEFVTACQLRLANTGSPEVLHQAFWYDDGNEPWPSEDLSGQDALPPDWPRDPMSLTEWNLHQALLTGNRTRLEHVLLAGNWEWRNHALIHWLANWQRPGPLHYHHANGDTATHLVFRGTLSWLAEIPFQRQGVSLPGLLDELFLALPWKPSLVHDLLLLVRQVFRKPGGDARTHGLNTPGPATSLASVGQLLDLLAQFSTLWKPVAGSTLNFDRESWADLLLVAYLRDRDARPLVRALAGNVPVVQETLVELASRLVIPGLAPQLRRSLRDAKAAVTRLALALGTQGERADGPRLLELVRQQPKHWELVLAVVRTGNAPCAEQARQLWKPGTAPSMWEIPYIREIEAMVAVELLRRDIRHQGEAWLEEDTDARFKQIVDSLEKLALLGWSGEEGRPGALVDRLRTRASEYHEHRWPTLIKRLDARWNQVQALDRRGWQALTLENDPISDPRRERWLWEQASVQQGETLSKVVEVLIHLRTQNAFLLPGLLGERLESVSWPVREQAALRVLGEDAPRDWFGNGTATCVRWLHGRGPLRHVCEENLQGIETNTPPMIIPRNEPAPAGFLYALVSGCEAERLGARAFLQAVERRDKPGFLWLLGQVVHYLPSDRAEAIVEEAFGWLDVNELDPEAFATQLMEHESVLWQTLMCRIVLSRHPTWASRVRAMLERKTSLARRDWLRGRLMEFDQECAQGDRKV